jgi:hypothetical protein
MRGRNLGRKNSVYMALAKKSLSALLAFPGIPLLPSRNRPNSEGTVNPDFQGHFVYPESAFSI